LVQSIVTWRLLRTLGIDTDLCIGVRDAGGTTEMHAWVEREGLVLNDVADVRRQFVVFTLPAETHAARASLRSRSLSA
jgi:hypothetical protein